MFFKKIIALSLITILNIASHSAAKPANALIFCAEAAPEGFDPPVWDAASTNNITRQMFETLVSFKPGGVEIVPELAEKWSISDDGLIYTFNLRKDVTFHTTPYFKPTRNFNADDVIFTFNRLINPNYPFNKGYRSEYIGSVNSGLADIIKSISKINEHTVVIELNKPNAPFISMLAMTVGSIMSAEYADNLLKNNLQNQINIKPIGTGPFVFKEYRKDASVRFENHPTYWDHKQKIAQLIFTISTDPNVRMQKLKQGECDIAASIPESVIDDLAAAKNIKIAETGAMNISYLAFNLKRENLAKKEVRIALDTAIDRDSIFKALFPKGGATQAVNPYPDTILGSNKQNKNEYNPDKAKKMLADAGYPDGFHIDLWALPVQRPTNPNGKLMAQMIQQDWEKIGVKATIRSFEWAEYLQRAGEGEHDVYMSGWTSDSGDPDDFLYGSLSCAVSKNGQRFCNQEFDALLEQGRLVADPIKRAEIYAKALAIFKAERPWITMAHSKIYIPMNKKVKGFIMNPNGGFIFKNVYREE